ncbi:MAG: U32 family peptidase, partial [Lachnospiraceae bacterium]|nr:U32 family peptidase [Lachnospiraceae bacterium]
ALHVSTQMTATGLGCAAMLGRLGVERIVPARELSLD